MNHIINEEVEKFKFHRKDIKFEIYVDKKSKYIPSYVNSILERWYGQGISTPAQAEQDRLQKGGKKKMTYGGAYDISAYESTSIADEE